MKILDRYIFFSFIKTFFAVFAILILIFLLQSVWVIISELAGKDLDIAVVGRLLFYIIPSLIPMVLPLTILVSSIMTFGDFSENYEFAAMKASGISLQRAMRSLILFITLLSISTYFVAAYVVPWSIFKSKNLRYNISQLKPALAITEGEFNQIDDYNIKVGKKTGKNGQDLHDVIIHLRDKGSGELIVIKSDRGKLAGGEDAGILSLILYDGTSYQNMQTRNYKQRVRRPFIKNGFEEYRFNIDISDRNDVDLNNDRFDNLASMLNISDLKLSIDSLSQRFNQDQDNFANTIFSRNGTQRIIAGDKPVITSAVRDTAVLKTVKRDSVQYNRITQEIVAYHADSISDAETDFFRIMAQSVLKNDSNDTLVNLPLTDQKAYREFYTQIAAQLSAEGKEFLDLYIARDKPKPADFSKKEQEEIASIKSLEDFYNSYDTRLRTQIADLAVNTTEGTLRTIRGKKENFKKKIERLNLTEIEIHDKYALAVMCYVLFFVGAPLGAIIRKGGIGMPMVVAIILFLVYYYIGMLAKNSARDGSISPFIATWLSTFIMLPLSVLVTYQATTDRSFFSLDVFIAPVKKLLVKIGLIKPQTQE